MPPCLSHPFPVPSPVAITTAPHALAQVGADGPRWVEMLRSGVHKSRFVGGSSASGHDVAEFTRADLESAARGFAAVKAEGYLLDGRAPVGYDHAEFSAALRMVTGKEPDDGEVFSAAAWVSDVRVEANDAGGFSLMGLHHFTDAGRSRVRAGGFRGYSIDIAPPGLMQTRAGEPIPEWVPFGGTLTNTPFVQSMAPVAATERAPLPNPTEVPQMDIKLLSGALSLSDTATEGEALAALHALTEKAAKADVLASELAAMTEQRDTAKAEFVALTERSEALTVKQAAHEGRIGLAQGPRYLKVLKALGEEEAHAIFPAGSIATRPSVAGSAKPDAGGPVTEDSVLAECISLSDKIQTERQISGPDAWVQAQRQIAQSDPAKAAIINHTAAEA